MTTAPDDALRLSMLRDLRRVGDAPRDKLDQLVRLAARHLGCDAAWLAVFDESERLQDMCVHGSAARPTASSTHAAVAQALVQEACAALPLAAPEPRTALACRITARQHTIGVLCVLDTASRTFDRTAHDDLDAFAGLAASLLDAVLQQEGWRQHAERVRIAGLSSSDWLWESDDAGRVVWVSTGVEAHTGQPASAVLGRTLSQINVRVDDDTSNSWERYVEARSRREPFRDILAYRDTSRGRIIVSMSGMPVFDDQGTFRGYRGTTSNVTQRIEAQRAARAAQELVAQQQEALQQSQAQLSAVLEAVPDLWFVLDERGYYITCSSERHPMLVHSWEQVRGKPFSAGVPEPIAERVLASIRRALATGDVQRIDYDLTTRDGVDRTFEARISPMPHQQVLYVTRDLTELRTLARDVLVMQRALEAEASLPICVADATQPDMPLIYVNPAFERLTGYSRAEALGRNCRFLQGNMRQQPAVTALREALEAGRSASVTLDNVRRNGSVFANAVHIAPVRDTGGQLTHYIGVLRDVTEQSRAADKLRVSEELYRSVAAAISDGLLVVTPSLGIIAINPAGCEMVGEEQTQVMNHGEAWSFELLDTDEAPLPKAQHPVLRVIAADAPLVNEVYALRRRDGQRRWVTLNAHPLRLRPDGGAFAVVLTFRDVTRQRASELALAAAEERWKFALEGSGDGLWDWDARSNTLHYSSRWKEMRGHADHEIGDSPDEWRSRTHPDDLQMVIAEIGRHMRGEVPFYDLEYRVRHKLGHYFWVRDRGKAVSRDDTGRALRVVGTQSDITRSKQAEQDVRDRKAAELASAAKSEFLSRMSHEMRTPLNAVIGFSQLLSLNPDALDAASVRDYAGHVLEAGEHLLALIDDVLDLQKIEEGSLSLNLRPVDLHDLVARTTELLTPEAQAGQVRLDSSVPPGLWVHADPQRLRQVLLAVGSNGIKYNHPGGTVRWRIDDAGEAGRVTLCVDDDGQGMTDEQMGRLFQPFERLGRETSAIEGTGLGLIIARSLAQAIGGKLEIRSRAGMGTTARIELQASEPTASVPATPAPAAQPEPEPEPPSTSLRMLYVEDNRINAILFEEAMRMHGDRIDLRIAEDGDQALTLARQWPPEVLVLDAHLPGMTGFEVLRLLRTLPGLDTVPAYMCSADAMPEDVKRAYEAGFVGYWTKPINVSTVLADVEQCMQRARGAA